MLRAIPEETQRILRNYVTLNDEACSAAITGQLDRATYVQVDKVLKDYGGKWTKSKGAHIFPSANAIAQLRTAISTGKTENVRTKKQAFYTPEDLAVRMVQLCGIQPGSQILEPSAGSGVLALAAQRAGGKVHCIEIDREDANKLAHEHGFRTNCEDFLGVKPREEYEGVIMNPPFTKGQDAKHILHAWKFLKKKGTLVAIAAGGALTKTTKPYPELAALVESTGYSEVLPPGTFKESGTQVGTVLIVLEK